MEANKQCKECDVAGCPGPDKLRHFASWSDLSSHISEDLLLRWVNHYAELISARNESGKRYRVRQQLMAQVAEKYLAKDELERIRAEAEERANG